MKTLNEYTALPYKMEIVEDKEEGGLEALKACIAFWQSIPKRKASL